MNRLEINWKPTRYRSRHPCWAGHDLVVLPHMGYLICNDTIWTRVSPFDFEESADGVISKIHSLSETINKEVIDKKREIRVRRTPAFRIYKRTIGLWKLECEIDTVCDIETGIYDAQEDIMHTPFTSRAITDCSIFILSKIRIIQNLFKRRGISLYLHNIRKLKMFQDVASKLPTEVIKYITELFVKNLNISNTINQNQHPPMLTIETELFKQLAFTDSHFPSI